MARFLVLWLFLFVSVAQAAEEVTLILSARLKPYLEFAEGFRKVLPEVRVFVLPEDGPLAKDYLEKHPQGAVAVGTKALRFLRPLPVENIFFALVISPEAAERILPHRHLCGLYLRLPPQITLPLLEELLSQGLGLEKKPFIILLPYSSLENLSFVEKAREVGETLGLQVKAVFVDRVSRLRTLLEQEEFDLLYCVPDPLFATEEAISLVLRLALLRGKAACGYNRFFLEKGALVSFVFDYQQVGEEAARRWRKGDCGPAPAPFEFVINQKVLDFLRKKLKAQKSKNAETPKREAAER